MLTSVAWLETARLGWQVWERLRFSGKGDDVGACGLSAGKQGPQQGRSAAPPLGGRGEGALKGVDSPPVSLRSWGV